LSFVSAKSLWKKFHGLYSRKHAGQDKDHDVDCDSDEVDEEEAIVDMEGELIKVLSDLNKVRKRNQILREEFPPSKTSSARN